MSSRLKPFFIKKDVWKSILMYSLSGRECLFLFGGKERTITHVIRIRNIARNGRTSAEWDVKEYRSAKKMILQMNLSHLADGHSHCDEYSLPHPSLIDIRNIRLGAIELICFPRDGTIRAWRISNTLKNTLKNEIEIRILP